MPEGETVLSERCELVTSNILPAGMLILSALYVMKDQRRSEKSLESSGGEAEMNLSGETDHRLIPDMCSAAGTCLLRFDLAV